MPRVPEGKARLEVYIPRGLADRLRAFVAEKYGEYRRGLLSAEVAAALEAWLAAHTHKRAPAARPNPLPRYYEVYQRVKRWIAERYGIDFASVHQVPRRFLEEAIRAVRGRDPRTVRGWIQLFMEQGLVKQITEHLVELL